MHKRAAVKSPLGAQTVLGDRHDLVYEIYLQVKSAACGTRPAEFFNGWARKRICDGSEKRSRENLIRQRFACAVGRLRNSPGRIFQRLGTQTDERRT